LGGFGGFGAPVKGMFLNSVPLCDRREAQSFIMKLCASLRSQRGTEFYFLVTRRKALGGLGAYGGKLGGGKRFRWDEVHVFWGIVQRVPEKNFLFTPLKSNDFRGEKWLFGAFLGGLASGCYGFSGHPLRVPQKCQKGTFGGGPQD